MKYYYQATHPKSILPGRIMKWWWRQIGVLFRPGPPNRETDHSAYSYALTGPSFFWTGQTVKPSFCEVQSQTLSVQSGTMGGQSFLLCLFDAFCCTESLVLSYSGLWGSNIRLAELFWFAQLGTFPFSPYQEKQWHPQLISHRKQKQRIRENGCTGIHQWYCFGELDSYIC